MGSSQILIIIVVNTIIALIIYLLFHNVAFKNIHKKLKGYNHRRYGFYECGFRTRSDLIAVHNVNMYIVMAIAILYDVECIYLLIIFTNIQYMCLIDLVLLLIYVGSILIGFYYERSIGALD